MISGVVPVRVGEDADRILVEGLGRAREELGGDLAVDVDVGRGGLDPILHRERVGPRCRRSR